MTDLYEDLVWRGLIHQSTDETFIPEWLRTGSRTLYVGFDPTADSLHVGSLLPLMMLRRFQRAGHKPIALVGGATGMIGDPSGKSEERNLLSVEKLQANVAGVERQLRQFLDFGAASNAASLVNNFDWMRSFSYLDFLRDVGKNFPVNVMLAKESVKNRIERESGISYTEFSYMLLQAYDFVHLSEKHGCELQVGGSDQWGNITAGIDLGRRMRGAKLFGLTCPLLTTSDGSKMGKTEKGAVWLSSERTSPYAFYQYWINVADADVSRCLRFLSEVPREEIEALDASRAGGGPVGESQRRLAESLTELTHGPEGLASAKRASEIFFGASIQDLDDAQLGEIFADVPSQELPRAQLEAGLPLIDAVVASGLSKSKGEVRRKIEEGGVYVNNVRCADKDRKLGTGDLASKTMLVLRLGRKNYALLRFA
ncbi:MAG TPA: tyrosine--tRNA ligase [Vicinamibacteria bacterium]|nr:tyrosine--tRNA ligase [Vicinamibacteria bacterium]HRB12241.1 tyrosine--tRNA ligase [Vicinamibacteria bacterium]